MTGLLALLPLTSQLPAAHAAVPPGSGAHLVTLQTPRPPARATLFAWLVRVPLPRDGGLLAAVQLSGCWSAREVVRVMTSRRSVRVRLDRRTGAIIADHLAGTHQHVLITVTFTTRRPSASAYAHALVTTARGHKTRLVVGGPACRGLPAPTATATAAPTDIPTSTAPPSPTATATAAPTDTPTATAAPSPMATATATATPTPTPTDAPTATATPSPTATATHAPTATATASPTATATATPTNAPTATATASPTATATATPTNAPTATATLSPTATATATPTNAPTATATLSPTVTDTATSLPMASATSTPTPAAPHTPVPSPTSCAQANSASYLHTCSSQIVDARGTPVQLRAANWYGFDSNDFVPAGLHYWSYKTIINRIKAQGFNALRLPFSNELVERNPVVSDFTSICVRHSCVAAPGTTSTPISGTYVLAAISDTVPNGDLVGLHALDIMQRIVDYAGSHGLYVILDDHRSQAGWNPEENGLWYTSATCPITAAPYTCYDPQSWLQDWQTVGALFANNPFVIGMDLRNEPHSASAPSTCAAYLAGAHWGPCGGQNNSTTDWAQAATQAGNALLALNPHWLIVVEGVSTYPQADGSFPKDGWGENLQGVATDPISLTIANQLVYSAHDYRWYQSNTTVTGMYSAWNRSFGFVAVPGTAYTAPVWVSEFGTCTDRYPLTQRNPPFTDRNTCIMSTPPGTPGYDEAGWWFNTFRFYEENQCVTDTTTNSSVCPAGVAPTYMGGPLSWGYWAANGLYTESFTYSNSTWHCSAQREGYGSLGGNMATPSSPLLLQSLFAGPSTDPAATLASAPAPSGPWPVGPPACTAYSG